MSKAYKIIQQLNRDFTYVKDSIQYNMREHWHVHTSKAGVPFEDDCDGYALTALYRLSKRSKWLMAWNVLVGKANLVHCQAVQRSGALGSGHLVLEWEGQYVDNIYPYWRSDLIHVFRKNYTIFRAMYKLIRSEVKD